LETCFELAFVQQKQEGHGMTTVFEINNAGQVIVGGTLVGAREIGTVQAAETRLPSYNALMVDLVDFFEVPRFRSPDRGSR
jgi:hypothetical protein